MDRGRKPRTRTGGWRRGCGSARERDTLHCVGPSCRTYDFVDRNTCRTGGGMARLRFSPS